MWWETTEVANIWVSRDADYEDSSFLWSDGTFVTEKEKNDVMCQNTVVHVETCRSVLSIYMYFNIEIGILDQYICWMWSALVGVLSFSELKKCTVKG